MIRAMEIAARLGLRRHPRSWRGRCPCCDYGGQIFSVREGRDGGVLLYCANGCSAEDLASAVARTTGQPPPPAPEPDASAPARKRERALALWRGSEPAVSTLADRYLAQRGLPDLAASPALRFRADTPHPEGGRLPALIALVSDTADGPIAVHRTYISPDARKARVEPSKASLGPVWGGAIRLDPLVPGDPLVIGEGIESAASAGRLMGLPAWAALSAGNMAKGLVLPPEARRVVIAADPDDAGRNAARAAWLRWKAEGRDVQIAIPDREGMDFNDVLLAQEAAHA